MTPIDWWRHTDSLPEPERIDVPTIAYPVVDRTEPTCPPQGEHPASAPAWDGTDRGMCVYGGGR